MVRIRRRNTVPNYMPPCRAPCWARVVVGEIYINKYGKTNKIKRSHDQLDTDFVNGQMPTSFPRLLIIESTKPDQPLAKPSPFIINVIVSVAG